MRVKFKWILFILVLASACGTQSGSITGISCDNSTLAAEPVSYETEGAILYRDQVRSFSGTCGDYINAAYIKNYPEVLTTDYWNNSQASTEAKAKMTTAITQLNAKYGR